MLYRNIVFPPYEFREFPKWVTPEGKDPVLVNSPEEEAAAMKRSPGRPRKVAAE